MAVLRSGILGNIRGKVAGVVGAQWKDKNYLREYVKPANPNTAAQQTQRTKMSDVVAFSKSLVGPVFNPYTDRFQKSMSGFNRFIKSNIDVFDGTPDFSAIKMTEGKLSNVGITSAKYDTSGGNTTVVFTESLGNNGASDDVVFAAAYDDTTGLWYFPGTEYIRSGLTLTILTGTGLNFENLENWIWTIKYSNTLVTMISDSVQVSSTEGP